MDARTRTWTRSRTGRTAPPRIPPPGQVWCCACCRNAMERSMQLNVLMKQARACRTCEASLPNPPNPLIQGSARARILIIGQAPGLAADQSGIPWDDRSGERLRAWMGIQNEDFYNPDIVALMPMGFCFPGTGKRGDLRPRPECAPQWHDQLLNGFQSVEFTILTGRYAFERYLADDHASITAASKAFQQLMPSRLALPHPSPRNNLWLRKNPWFDRDVVPRLRRRVKAILNS